MWVTCQGLSLGQSSSSSSSSSSSPEVNAIDYSMAQCCLCLRQLAKALHIAKDVCLPDRIALYGDDSLEVSHTHNLIGLIHAAEGRLEEAIKSFERGMRIREGLPAVGRQHISYATLSGNLSLVYILLQDLAKAGVILSQSLEMKDRFIGPANGDVEVALLNFAAIFKAQNNKDVAKDLEQGVVKIRKANSCKQAKVNLHIPSPSCPCQLCWDDATLKY
jgi:tetratricopeptide (TPR) repeat protein